MDGEHNVETTRFILNGAAVAVTAPSDERLSDSLRERLGARDVKIGCNAGDCGACSVLLDGQVVCSCLTPTHKAEGRRIETVAGLVTTDPLAQALAGRFQDHGAAQCGFCTPGMVMSCAALLAKNPAPTRAECAEGISGNICRCGTYLNIFRAMDRASALAKGGK